MKQMQSKRWTESGPMNVGDPCAARVVAQAGQGRGDDRRHIGEAIVDVRFLGGQIGASAAACQAGVAWLIGMFVIAALMVASDLAMLGCVRSAQVQPATAQ